MRDWLGTCILRLFLLFSGINTIFSLDFWEAGCADMVRHTPVAALLQSGRDNGTGFNTLVVNNRIDQRSLGVNPAKTGWNSSGQSKLYDNAVDR